MTVTVKNEDVSINDDTTSQLDVTGTPLEDNCDITVISDWSVIKKYVKTNPWTDEEEQCGSVNEDLATKIVNEINVGLGSKCKNGAMFAICDASTEDHQFLLYTEYDKDWNWRGVGTFTVSMSHRWNTSMIYHCISIPGSDSIQRNQCAHFDQEASESDVEL